MAIENITLNLIPTGDTPSIHVAQFDVDRPFNVTLKEGEDDFTPTGYTIELQVRKVDNNIVTAVPVQTSDNVVTFNTTQQMTACSGTNLAELQLTKDSQTFATLHFYLVVQRDVLAGGFTSESDIYNLTEQIAAIVPEVIGDDYYNKEEVDEKIAEIPTFDPTNYYDKSETDALLDDKADVSDLPDMSNYYDKSETDALLDDKADVSDLPDMSNYYTKSEVDTKITDLYQIKTVSGSIAHFTDGGNNIPVKSLVSEILAVESGSGEKSPTNPYTISGFDSGVVTRCGKNLLSLSNVDFTLKSVRYYTLDGDFYLNGTSTGETSSKDTAFKNNLNFLLKAGTYYFSRGNLNIDTYLYDYEDNTKPAIVTNSGSFTLTEDTRVYIGFYVYNQTFNNLKSEIMVSVGSSATTFEAYNGNTYTFTFGQTVYGGHFDNKGNLVVTHGFITLDGSLNYTPNGATANTSRFIVAISGKAYGRDNFTSDRFVTSISSDVVGNAVGRLSNSSIEFYLPTTVAQTTADAKQWFTDNPTQLVYELVTPITLAITSQYIPTLLGENNIFSNCGDVEVNYFTSKSDGIAELIKAFM